MAVPSISTGLSSTSAATEAGIPWSIGAIRRGIDAQLASSGLPQESRWSSMIPVLKQLFRVTRVSLRGYLELASMSAQPGLRTLFEVISRQRSAQCRALAQLSSGMIDENPNQEDGYGGELEYDDPEILWTRVLWNFEQDELGRFSEYLDLAELALEDAYLAAADAISDRELATNFRQFAVSICGARQCLEEATAAQLRCGRY